MLVRKFVSRPFAAAIVALSFAAILLLSSCAPGGSIIIAQGWSGPTVSQGTLYIGTREGKLVAVNTSALNVATPLDVEALKLNSKNPPTNAAVKWRFPNDEKSIGSIYSTPLLVSDTVIFGTLGTNQTRTDRGNGFVYALNASDGTPKWTPFPLNGRLFADPVVENNVIFVADDDNETGYVYAINLTDGTKVWANPFKVGRRLWSTPQVVDGIVYVSAMDKNVYALDAATGNLIRSYKVTGAVTSKPLVVGDILYFGDYDRKFYAFDRNTGEKKWTLDGDGWFWNDAIEKDGTIYVGSLGKTFYAITPSGSATEHLVDSQVRAKPVTDGNLVYVIGRNGTITGFDATGATKYSQLVGGEVLASPALVDGKLYVIDLDQRIHMFALRS